MSDLMILSRGHSVRGELNSNLMLADTLCAPKEYCGRLLNLEKLAMTDLFLRRNVRQWVTSEELLADMALSLLIQVDRAQYPGRHWS